MKLALHRSIAFWSGLLVMGFVCWGWRDSLRAESVAESRGFVVTNIGSGVTLAYKQELRAEAWYSYRESFPGDDWNVLKEWRIPPPKFYRRPADYSRRPLFLTEDAFSATSLIFMPVSVYGRTGDWLLFLPHWLVLVSIAVPWLGLLFWRARRRKRHMYQEP